MGYGDYPKRPIIIVVCPLNALIECHIKELRPVKASDPSSFHHNKCLEKRSFKVVNSFSVATSCTEHAQGAGKLPRRSSTSRDRTKRPSWGLITRLLKDYRQADNGRPWGNDRWNAKLFGRGTKCREKNRDKG